MSKKSKSAPSKPRPKTAQLSKEVQARLSAFVNSSTEGFALLDENLNYMFINPVAEKMIGVSREAVVGKNILDIVPNVKEAGRYDKYLKVLKTGKPFHIEDMVSHTKFRDIHAGLKAFRVENWLGLVFTDITERKQAEETLGQSEQNYRVLFEGTLVGLFVVNAETGRIVLANRTAARMFGFDSPEAMIGVDPINLFTPKDRNGVLRFVAEDVLRDLSEEWLHSDRKAREIRVITNDGGEIWLEIQGTPTEYQGKLAYLVSNKDITERKQAEEEIQSLAKFPSENPCPVLRVAKDGKVLYSNKAGLELLDEWKMKIGEKVPGEWCRLIEEAFESGQPRSEEEEVKDKIFSLDIALIKESGYVNLYGHDITERKRMEEALRESEERNRALVEAAGKAGECIGIVQNVDGREAAFVFVTDEFCRLVGYSREELLLMKAQDLINPDEFNEIMDRYKRRQRGEDVSTRYELTFIHKDGTLIPVEAGFGIMTYSGKVATVAFLRDITERKQAEEQERRHSHDLDLLSKAAIALVELRPDADIHHFIAERLQELAEGAAVLVNSFDEASDTFCVREALGIGGKMEELTRILGFNLIGMPTPIGDEARQGLSSAELAEVRGGVYDLASGALPMPACQEIEKLLDVSSVYAIGLAWEGRLYGSTVILTRNKTELRNKDVIETFIRQASIALQRRQAEEALRKSEELLKAQFDNSPDIILIVDRNFKFVKINRILAGPYTTEGLVGQDAIAVLPPSEQEPVRNKIAACFDTGEVQDIEHEIGEGRWVRARIAPIKSDGIVKYVVVLSADITERKKSEEALRNERDNLLNTLNAMKDGVYIINQQNDIVFANPSTKEEFGPYEGKKCYEYFHDFKGPCSWCDVREVSAGKVIRSEWFFPTNGKTYEVVHTPFRETEGSISKLSIIRDITERKRMEDALRKSEQTIRQLAKASTSAHEEERQRVSLEVHDRISQTLTGAFHQLQALEAIPIENTGAQQILKRASDLLQESIRESRNIIEDLYSPVLSDFGIVAVIDEELRRFQEETGCRTKFDKRFAVRPTPDVELTAYRIFREVLANIKRHAIGASEVKVSFSCEAGVVSLQVKDNGPGFDVEAALQNGRMGGLKGMQRRAELGGGACEVISSRGHGTTVTVRLPYSSEA